MSVSWFGSPDCSKGIKMKDICRVWLLRSSVSSSWSEIVEKHLSVLQSSPWSSAASGSCPCRSAAPAPPEQAGSGTEVARVADQRRGKALACRGQHREPPTSDHSSLVMLVGVGCVFCGRLYGKGLLDGTFLEAQQRILSLMALLIC